jgi:micrococcal nuclease
MYKYKVEVIRVVDGDTVDVNLDLGFGIWLKGERVRLMGIDTPESRTRDLEEKFYGKCSKKFLKEFLKDSDVRLVSHGKGKFGRILGELFVGDKCVNQEIINNFHAVPYFGQSKDDVQQGHMWNRAALNEQGINYNK